VSYLWVPFCVCTLRAQSDAVTFQYSGYISSINNDHESSLTLGNGSTIKAGDRADGTVTVWGQSAPDQNPDPSIGDYDIDFPPDGYDYGLTFSFTLGGATSDRGA
jgi:hypothetical protein